MINLPGSDPTIQINLGGMRQVGAILSEENLALTAGIRRAAREQVQSQSLQRLARLGAPLLKLPFLLGGSASLPAIGKLTTALASQR